MDINVIKMNHFISCLVFVLLLFLYQCKEREFYKVAEKFSVNMTDAV